MIPRASILHLLIFLAIIKASSCYVIYQPCNEYVYNFKAKSQLEKGDSVAWKAQFGIEFLNSTKKPEALLRLYDVRIQSRGVEKSLLDQYKFGGWFSMVFEPDGEVTEVHYPRKYKFDVIFIKKTIVNYLSSKFNQLDDPWKYTVSESSIAGHVKAHYTRITDGFDTIYKKVDDHTFHPANEYSHVTSEKKVYISHDFRVPRLIKMKQHMNMFHRSKKKFEPHKMNLSPTGRVDIHKDSEKIKIPSFTMGGHGTMELVDSRKTPCTISRPLGLQKDTLHVPLNPDTTKNLWKINFKKQKDYIYECLDTNLTCIRNELKSSDPPAGECFQKLHQTLAKIPDENLSSIMEHYFENSTINTGDEARQNQLIMIDAMVSLQTSVGLENIYNWILSPEAKTNRELLLRSVHQIGNLLILPNQKIVLAIKKLAFRRSSNVDKELRYAAILTYGSLTRLYVHHTVKVTQHHGFKMLKILHSYVGIHDPYHWKRAKRDTDQMVQDKEFEQAVLVEALGNVGHTQSLDHIVSYVNHSDTPLILKRAGLHALRLIHTEEAAEALLEAVLFDAEEHTRYTAYNIYLKHPLKQDVQKIYKELKTGYENHRFPRCPKPLPHESELQHHHRIIRRSILKKMNKPLLEFNLRTPELNYVWAIGNDKLGAGAGLKVRNEIDIKLGLKGGHVRVYVDDRAYFKVHIGLIGWQFTFLDAHVCYVGSFEYNLDILKELNMDGVAKVVRYWDRVQNGVVLRLKLAIGNFKQFVSGVKSIPNAIESFIKIIDDIPKNFDTYFKVVKKAMSDLGTFEEIPFIQDLVKVYRRIGELFSNIRSDIKDSINSIVDVVKVQLPLAWEQARKALTELGKSVVTLFKTPVQAIQGIFKSIFKIKVAIVDGIKSGWSRIKKALYLDDGEKPSWWNLKEIITEILQDLASAWKAFQQNVQRWIAQGPNKKEREMVFAVMKDIYTKLQSILRIADLKNALEQGVNLFENLLKPLLSAWENLKLTYEETRSLIDSIFGPKADADFPKVIRSAGGGCDEDGSYQNSFVGRYSDRGIDLEATAGSIISVPFSGYLSRISDNKLMIEPDGSMFDELNVYITNVKVSDSILPGGKRRKIYTGDALGSVQRTTCVDHIHVSMKDKNGYVDPTRYLARKDVKIPGLNVICSEHKLIYMNQVKAYGSFLPHPAEEDTTPGRSTSVPQPVTFPSDSPPSSRTARDTGSAEESFENSYKANKNSWSNIFKSVIGLPEDSTFNGFFKKFSINKMTFGTIVGLLDTLKMHKSKTDIISLLKRFIELTKNSKCIRPQEMLDDELRVILNQRGIKANGSRSDMINAYYQRQSKCPFWSTSLPVQSSCKVDDNCLGIECCFDYKFGIFYKAVKGYAVLDPCQLKLHIGIDVYPYNWSKIINGSQLDLVTRAELMTGLKIKLVVGTYELKVGYEIVKDKEKFFFSLWINLCEALNDCYPNFYFINELLLPIPQCLPNGTIIFPKLDMKEVFNRKAILKKLKAVKNIDIDTIVDSTIQSIAAKLSLPLTFLQSDSGHKCSSPSKMTVSQLAAAANVNSTRVNRSVLEHIVREKLRRCRWFTLPAIPSAARKYIFCNVSRNCFHVQCCLDIPVPLSENKSISLSASAKYDPCTFVLTFRFHSLKKELSLIDYEWGQEKQWRHGPIVLKYLVTRSSDKKQFIVKFGLKFCVPGYPCLIDHWILSANRIPVPLCNEKYLECFKGENSIKSLIKNKKAPVSKYAKARFIQCLELDNILVNIEINTNWTSLLRPLWHQLGHRSRRDIKWPCGIKSNSWTNRYCSSGDKCWHFNCHMALKLFVVKLSVSASFVFDPCTYDVAIKLGKWEKSFNLMQRFMDVEHEIRIGKVLAIFFKYGEGNLNTTFKFNLYVRLCLDDSCTPNQYILKNIEIGKPFCHPNFTQTLPGGSVSAFLAILGVNDTRSAKRTLVRVSRLAVDRVLESLTLKQCLSPTTCVRTTATHLYGWDNQCKWITSLPALPSDLRCSIEEDCMSIQCCLDANINIWQGSLTLNMSFDPCNLKLTFTFENCSLDIPLRFSQQIEVPIYKVIKLGLRVEGEGNQLSISVYVKLCLLKCFKIDILKDTAFSLNLCPKTRHKREIRSVKSRSKSSNLLAMKRKFGSKKVPYNTFMKPMAIVPSKRLKNFFGGPTVGCEDRCVFSSSKSAPRFLPENGPDMDFNVKASLGGMSIFDHKRGTKGSLLYLIGKGLTEAGKAAMGDRLANMTIGDIAVVMEAKNVDPVRVYELVRNLRDTFSAITAEVINVIFGGGLRDFFKTFDLSTQISISFPTQFLTFANPEIWFFIPPIPCMFVTGLHLSGFYGVNFNGQLRVMTKRVNCVLDPYVGALARAYGGMNCFIFKGEISLNAYILRTHLPINAEIGFKKFPLKVTYCIDLVTWPLRVELVTEFYIRVLFFMKKKRWSIFRAIFRFVARILRRVFKWKLLFRKVLWSWSARPWRINCFLQSDDKEPDLSPPIIENGRCLVKQVKGVPKEEPKVEIKADVFDDRSTVRNVYSIGTSHGLDNLVKNKRYEGPSAILDLGPHRHHKKLFFKLTSTNDQGLTVQYFCNVMLDITPPQISVFPKYTKSSDRSVLEATAIITEESPISSAYVSFGLGPGQADSQSSWMKLSYRIMWPPNVRAKRYKADISFTGLSLLHGQLYFINVRVNDTLGYTTIQASEPIIIDLTHPMSANESGVVSSVITGRCEDFTLRKWQPFCGKSVHSGKQRILRDNPHSKLFWNGLDRHKELRWTRINKFITACFQPFSDIESSIRGYSVCIGKTFCQCDFMPLVDAHEGVKLESDWDYCAHIVRPGHRAFPEGRYYWKMTVFNKVPHGGHLGSTLCHHRPYVIDTSPPEIYSVSELRLNLNTSIFSFQMRCGDGQSGLSSLKIGMGRTRHDLSLQPLKVVQQWTTEVHTFDGYLSVQLDNQLSGKAYVHFLLENKVELVKALTPIRPIVIDTTPPIPGKVYMGTTIGINKRFFGKADQLCVSWTSFNDSESGIDSYIVQFKTCVNCSALFTIDNIKPNQTSVCLPKSEGKRLVDTNSYYGTVVAINAGHDKLRSEATSSSIVYDNTPPVPGRVVDGSLPNYIDQNFTTRQSVYSVQWTPSNDSISGIEAYRVSVYINRSSSAPPITENLTNKTILPNTQKQFSLSGLHLQHTDKIWTNVEPVNGGGLTTTVYTDGILVDLTAPVIYLVTDTSSSSNRGFQTSTSTLNVTIGASDHESGLTHAKLQMFEINNNQKQLTGTVVRQTLGGKSFTGTITYNAGQVLLTGHHYGCRLTITNGAGATAVRDSEGTVVDDTPPLITGLVVGSDLDSAIRIHNGFIWHAQSTKLVLRVQAFDSESQIHSIFVSVGTRRGAADMLPVTRFGGVGVIVLPHINFTLSDMTTNTIPEPSYYVTVMAENFAGLRSPPVHSQPIIILPSDSAGLVFDGPGPVDDDAQLDRGLVTATFKDFSSPLHGISHFEVGVGTKPGLDDVESFSEEGIVNVAADHSSGAVHLPSELSENVTYFVTIRAYTNAGNFLESSSDGFLVRQVPLNNRLLVTAPAQSSNGIIYVKRVTTLEYDLEIKKDETGFLIVNDQRCVAPRLCQGNATNSTQIGVPSYISVQVTDKLGLQKTMQTVAVVVDKTPPKLDSFDCDNWIKAGENSITCRLSGLADYESPIIRIDAALITERLTSSRPIVRMQFNTPISQVTFILTAYDRRLLNNTFYARVKIVNAGGWETEQFSSPILSEPIGQRAGVVVNLGDSKRLKWQNDTKITRTRRSVDTMNASLPLCTSKKECQALAQKCQIALDEVAVAWEPFANRRLIKHYRVALGTTKGNVDIKNWTIVDPMQSSVIIHNINLQSTRKVFSTVEAVTKFGTIHGTSDAIFINKPSILSHRGSFNPVKLSKHEMYGFADPMTLAVSLNFSASPCPIEKAEWSIEKLDGTVVMPYTNTQGKTYLQYFGLNSEDGEMFFVKVRTLDSMNITQYFQSNGLVIERESIEPGSVFDGPVIGHDLEKQTDIRSLSVNWNGFKIPNAAVHQSANVAEDRRPHIAYYEVAIGTKNSLSDVAGFKPAGLNTTITFYDLLLTPGVSYFATVRAHSRWFKSVEKRSNGIIVGVNATIAKSPITIQWSPQTPNIVDTQWSAFKSSLPLKKMYFTGMRETSVSAELDCNEIISLLMDENRMKQYYNVAPLATILNKGSDSISVESLQHGKNYTVEVTGLNIAGQCAVSRGYLLVDFTPPTSGSIVLSDLNLYKSIYFSRNKDFLRGNISGFFDPESGIRSFTISLLESESNTCQPRNWRITKLKTGKDCTTETTEAIEEFFIEEVELKTNVVYMIQVNVTNGFSLSTTIHSNKILVENTTINNGKIKPGLNYRAKEQLFMSLEDGIPYSFVHGFSEAAATLLMPTDTKTWKTIKKNGVSVTDDYPWTILHDPAAVVYGSDSLIVKLHRLIGQNGLRAGAVTTNTSFYEGATYNFKLKTATGPFGVTGFLLWGANTSVPGVIKPATENVENIECRCCDLPSTVLLTINCTCNCTEYWEAKAIPDKKLTKTLPEFSWSVNHNTKAPVPTADACGIQLYELSNAHYLQGWCYNNKTRAISSEVQKLRFNPSVGFHDYEIKFEKLATEDWMMKVIIDNREALELVGVIPTLPSTVQSVFHVFNHWTSLPNVRSARAGYSTAAEIKHIRLPPLHMSLLSFGNPFLTSQPTQSTFEARLIEKLPSNNSKSENVIYDWMKILEPCIPCSRQFQCSALFCSADCKNKLNIFHGNFTPKNDTSIKSAQVQLRIQTIGGSSKIVTSSPIIIDSTPPVQEASIPLTYHDVENKDYFKPVKVQASNDTISVQFTIVDPESGILNFLMAIGTQPDTNDISDFVDLGKQAWVNRTNLKLKNNVTYYTTVIAINNAHQGSKFIDVEGVRVFSTPPDVTGMKTALPDCHPMKRGVRSPNTMITERNDKIAINWTQPTDQNIKKAEYCVGSTDDIKDDIVSCMTLEHNPNDDREPTAGSLDIEDGKVNGNSKNAVNVSDFQRSARKHQRAGIHIEPGRVIHHHLSMCTEAEKCTELPTARTQVATPGTRLLTNGERAPISVSSPQVARRRRFRRDTSTAYNVRYDVQMTPGELNGTSLLLGEVNDTAYSVDTSGKFKSYIVDPSQTSNNVSRLLNRRILHFLNKGIFVSTAGQVELKGPLSISVAFEGLSVAPENIVRLLYWSTDEHIWRFADMTCNDGKHNLYSNATFISVNVCRTQTNATKPETPTNATLKYFKFETQFAAALLLRDFPNSPPVIRQPPPLHLNGTESSLLAKLQMHATDPEGDKIEWTLATPLPSLGVATIDRNSGMTSYAPRVGSIGYDEIRLMARDRPVPSTIPSKNATVIIPVYMTTSVNYPIVLPYVDNEEVNVTVTDTKLKAQINLVGRNKDSLECRIPKQFDIYSFDYDVNDNIHLEIINASDTFQFGERSTVLNVSRSDNVLPIPPNKYETKQKIPVIYPKNSGEYHLTIAGKDSHGQYSMPLEMEVHIHPSYPCVIKTNMTDIIPDPPTSHWKIIVGVVVTTFVILIFIVGSVIYIKTQGKRVEPELTNIQDVDSRRSSTAELLSSFDRSVLLTGKRESSVGLMLVQPASSSNMADFSHVDRIFDLSGSKEESTV